MKVKKKYTSIIQYYINNRYNINALHCLFKYEKV